jgi:hypothetical protein
VLLAALASETALQALQTVRPFLIGAAAIVAMIVAVILKADRWTFAATVAIALMLIRIIPDDRGQIETVRSFFGVHKILETKDQRYHLLMHGTTVHGAQKVRNDDGTPVTGRPEAISYYHSEGGIARAIAAVRAQTARPMRAAVIGLGSAALTCAAKPGESWKFFEIDQSIVDIARNPARFSFIENCQPGLQPVMGDARLTFAKEPDALYDLVIIDAYSSDAIPIHLATREAMSIYKSKLAPHGAIVMHISNRHLELASVVVGIAAANGLNSWVFMNNPGRDAEFIFANNVVISARDSADVGGIARSDAWTARLPDPQQRVWTDDYSNILGALWRRMQGA